MPDVCFASDVVVVDLAVENRADRGVLVGDRRIAGHEVDDRQPVLRDDRARLLEATARVGTAMVQQPELLVDGRGRRFSPADAA
jgi:hypothetical protein